MVVQAGLGFNINTNTTEAAAEVAIEATTEIAAEITAELISGTKLNFNYSSGNP